MASIGKVTINNATEISGASTTSTAVTVNPKSDHFVAFIKNSALGSGTTLNCKIQHSPNNSDWFDLVAFTAITSSGTAEIKDQASFGVANQNVLPWVRTVSTLAAGTTTATITVELYFDPV